VLPALVPDLSYSGLAIAEGGTAAVALERLLFERDSMSDKEVSKLRNDLLKYCELDTLAMVRLNGRLMELVDKEIVHAKSTY